MVLLIHLHDWTTTIYLLMELLASVSVLVSVVALLLLGPTLRITVGFALRLRC